MPIETLVDMPKAGSGLIRKSEKPRQANRSAISFPIIYVYPGTKTSYIRLGSARFARDWWQSHTNLELIRKLSKTLIAALLIERIYKYI